MTAQSPKFYTLKELEELTGFDGRTIYFYVQEGLVPKLGRRGRTSQYPQVFLDRLLFIKKLKALQDSGEISPITLRDIRRVMHNIPPDTVARVAAGEEPLQAIQLDLAGGSVSEYGPVASLRPDKLEELRQLKVEGRFQGTTPGLGGSDDPDEWTTLSVTDDIFLTVRGKNAKSTPLVQRLIQLIRKAVGMGG
jgi:DNA-binding transcriptional MerR regulator